MAGLDQELKEVFLYQVKDNVAKTALKELKNTSQFSMISPRAPLPNFHFPVRKILITICLKFLCDIEKYKCRCSESRFQIFYQPSHALFIFLFLSSFFRMIKKK